MVLGVPKNFPRFARGVLFFTKSQNFLRASRGRFYSLQNPEIFSPALRAGGFILYKIPKFFHRLVSRRGGFNSISPVVQLLSAFSMFSCLRDDQWNFCWKLNPGFSKHSVFTKIPTSTLFCVLHHRFLGRRAGRWCRTHNVVCAPLWEVTTRFVAFLQKKWNRFLF